MANLDTQYIRIKVFLYKYSPVFTPVDSTTNKDSGELKRIRNEIKNRQDEISRLSSNNNPNRKHVEIPSIELKKQWDSIMGKYTRFNVGSYGAYKTACEGKNKGDDILTKLANTAGIELLSGVTSSGLGLNKYWKQIITFYLENKLRENNILKSLSSDISLLSNIENNFHSVYSAENRYTIETRKRMWAETKAFIDKTVANNPDVKGLNEDATKIVSLQKEIKYWKDQETKFNQGLGNVQRFSIDLDEKYFSKIDISDFVIDYRFSYGIHNQLDWNINFHNGTLDLAYLGTEQKNKYFIKMGQGLLQSDSDYSTLADFETEDDNFEGNYFDNIKIVQKAMEARTKNVTTNVTKQASSSEQDADISNRKPQVLLSDLIQKFDFVSLYIYKDKNPIDDDELNYDMVAVKCQEKNIQFEEWLSQIGFSNEFNGFVIGKTPITQVGNLNTLSVTGAGSFCLLDRTKTLYSPTLFTGSLYDQSELFNTNQLTVFSSLFSDKSIIDIANIILRDIYCIIPTYQDPTLSFNKVNDLSKEDKVAYYNKKIREMQTLKKSALQIEKAKKEGFYKGNIKFSSDYYAQQIANLQESYNSSFTVTQKYGTNFNVYNKEAYTRLEDRLKKINTTYFLDIIRMKIENVVNINIATIAPYLYSIVMSQRGCHYRDASESEIDLAGSFLAGQQSLGIQFNKYMTSRFPSDKVTFGNSPSSHSPVHFDVDVDTLAPYFKFIENGFSNFNPTLKTPNQILDDVKAASFIEIFEVSSGILILRTPKYNDKDSIMFSNEFNVITTSYPDNIKNVLSKQKLSYHPDLIKDLPFCLFSYTNGKYLTQYGLTEAESAANPNVKYTTSKGEKEEVNKKMAIFHYARFFLEINNAMQKTSNIVMEYEPATVFIKNSSNNQIAQAIGVGNLFFDEMNNKISYITQITKSCRVGGDLSMVMTGTFVRDCYMDFAESNTVNFRLLPEIFDINKKFATVEESSKIQKNEMTSQVTNTEPYSTQTTSVAIQGRQ